MWCHQHDGRRPRVVEQVRRIARECNALDGRERQRRALRFLGFGGVSTAVQKMTASRFAAAVACARADPATAFAPLSHMLKNGFFFNQGFFMIGSLSECGVF
jgi:hypothetical protein